MSGQDVDRCVVCARSLRRPEDGGLCDDHKYDEQRAAAEDSP